MASTILTAVPPSSASTAPSAPALHRASFDSRDSAHPDWESSQSSLPSTLPQSSLPSTLPSASMPPMSNMHIVPSSQQSQQSQQHSSQQHPSQHSQHSQHSHSSQSFSQPSSQALYRKNDKRDRMPDHVMPIYTATYSGVNVYEMEVNNVAVMRRQNDSWLNATQILKVAGVDKGRRTKVLEKEIQTGEHEKVQGGYGKYQGTWIPFERGLDICRQFDVEALLRTLLTHNMRPDGAGGHGSCADIDTPTKEQAMAAQRKRMYNAAGGLDLRTSGASGTFFKNISSTASQAVAAISKARFDSPGPRSRGGNQSRAPSFHRQSTDEFPAGSQQSHASDYGPSQSQHTEPNGDPSEPPRKRPRIAMTPGGDNNGSFGYSASAYANAFPGSPTEPNESFIYTQAGIHVGEEPQPASTDASGPLRPLPFEVSPDAEHKRNLLMGLFMDGGGNKLDVLRTLAPAELDVPIDPQSHTALHWAATLSRMGLVQALVAAGASAQRVNGAGETALMRACLVTNSMDLNSFPELLDVLGGTIDVRDDKGRTVLHHIALTSAVNGRNMASRYYLESLLEWVVRQGSGSAPSSQATQSPSMGIGRFMSEIVNAQDLSGDTALNVAARVGNRSIISQLIEVGADPKLPNRAGLRPLDFGIGLEQGDAGDVEEGGSVPASTKTRESSEEVVNSISHLLAESSSLFRDELRTKQQAIDALHASLRTTSTQIGDARRALDALQEKVRDQQLARQRVLNLGRACEEENYRVLQLEQAHGRLDVARAVAWEKAVEESRDDSSVSLLRARIAAVRRRDTDTRQAVEGLRARSRDVELKYRHLVSLCTRRPDGEIDVLLDGLTRAVESEKGELEISRVRRFLGGVEAH